MTPRRLSLTTRGFVALGLAPVSVVAGVLLGAEELVLLGLALGTLLACAFGQSAQRARLARGNWRLTVGLPASDVEAGTPLRVTITAAASGRGGAVPTALEDPVNGWDRVRHGHPVTARFPLPHPALTVRLPQLESGASTVLVFPAPSRDRGIYTLRSMRHWCFDGFGLVARLIGVTPSATITVYPKAARVEVPDALLSGEYSGDAEPPANPLGPKRRDSLGDFAGIRRYVPGDRLRLLYWPALARTGELMVRDFEDVGPRRVHLLADVRPLLGHRGAEAVLAAAAGVGQRVLAQGATLEFATSAGEQLAIGPGPYAAMALLRALAATETAPITPSLRQTRRTRRGNRPPPATTHRLIPTGESPLIITTADGALTLPTTLGSAHLVIAP